MIASWLRSLCGFWLCGFGVCRVWGLVMVIGCAESGSRAGAADPPRAGVPAGPMSLQDATRFVLQLVNHDRADHGLGAVEWDDTAARAAQRHAEDMATHGFTSHWGTDGSVPEQRYTEAGGTHMVQENSACFFDAVARELDQGPGYLAAELEKIESAFVSELPPHDGHRKNILKPVHNRLGIGLARPIGLDRPCMAQEFVDQYGEYDRLPAEAHVGQSIRIGGEVSSPVKFGGVGLARIDLGKPRAPKALNQTSTYRISDPYALYFPRGFKTPKPVELQGSHFSIELGLDDHGRPGRYEVSVWGRYPGSEALEIVSLRTILVR